MLAIFLIKTKANNNDSNIFDWLTIGQFSLPGFTFNIFFLKTICTVTVEIHSSTTCSKTFNPNTYNICLQQMKFFSLGQTWPNNAGVSIITGLKRQRALTYMPLPCLHVSPLCAFIDHIQATKKIKITIATLASKIVRKLSGWRGKILTLRDGISNPLPR